MALSFFLRLALGHLIGDFVLQPYWLVIAKRNGWTGLFIHVGVVTFVSAILIWAFIPNWWVWVIVLFIGHLFIDQFRTFVFTDNSNGKGLLLLILDQLAHIILLILLAWAATGWRFADLQLIVTDTASAQYHLLVYLIGLATLVGVTPILEAEITAAVFAVQGDAATHTIAVTTADRIWGGLERVAALTLMLTGLAWLAPLAFIPRLAMLVHQGQYRANRTGVIARVITSFGVTVVTGALLYFVPFPRF